MGGVTDAHELSAKPRILIIVQNLPVPFDRRVWLECKALTAAGYDVTVVCPKGKNDPGHEVLEGVTLLKYRPYAPGGGALGFVVEYVYSFLATATLVLRARRGGKFQVLQACNPPDIFWPIARWMRRRDSSRFVFDHHDLCPELYDSRFPNGSALPRRGLIALEKATFHTADHVVATNASYAEIAMRRGEKDSADGDSGANRPRPGAAASKGAGPGIAAGSQSPRRVHRRHGAAGRRRPGGSGRSIRRSQPRSRGRRIHLHGRRRQLSPARGTARRARTAGLPRTARPSSRRHGPRRTFDS